MTIPVAVCAALALVAAAGAAAQQPARPTDAGATLFGQRCAGCHAETGWATRVLARRVPAGEAPLAARRGLAAETVQAVVRSGIGMMPAIRKAELGDRDLAAIADYLARGDGK